MGKPNTLLKVVSIIYIVVAALGIVLGLLVAVLGGAVLGSAAESAGFGLAVGGIMGVLMVGGSVYNLVAGILGVKGKFTGCKVMGIIALVFAVISAVVSLFTTTDLSRAILPAVAALVLPVLYVCGAFMGPQ